MAEIIQQWQFPGKVHPELLEDSAFESCQKLGITSLQSYFTWAGIEKEKDRFDFSDYDILVEKIKKHNLKWVPFLILGPEYATPGWFKKSTEAVFAKCLEHGQEGAIQSIWNPYLKKHIERFLKAASRHYRDHKIFESITLGISGNWGEAVYPAEGGFNRNFHTHLGFWAGDQYARGSFIKFVLSKYKKINSLNSAWGKNYKGFQEIGFPVFEKEERRALFNSVSGAFRQMPSFIKTPLRLVKNLLLDASGNKFSLVFEPDFKACGLEKEGGKKQWQDFMEWYFNSMSDFAEFWLKAARKHFPQTKIYLVTGGIGEPASGADFSQQVKIAKKYKAGIRITNQTNDYQQSFILTRLVSSAARFYGVYFTTEEEAILQTGPGLVMRIFDALSSGAVGLYCKNFISTGNDDPCIKKDLPAGKITTAGRSLGKNLGLLSFKNSIRKPLIKTAVLFPLNYIILDSGLIKGLYNQSAQIRDILDFDLIDERMILDGALPKYEFLLVLAGNLPSGKILDKIKKWENRGGKIVVGPKKEDLEKLSREINEIDSKFDGVFATRFEKEIIYYNANNNKKIKKEIKLLNKIIEIEPHSISIIKV